MWLGVSRWDHVFIKHFRECLTPTECSRGGSDGNGSGRSGKEGEGKERGAGRVGGVGKGGRTINTIIC